MVRNWKTNNRKFYSFAWTLNSEGRLVIGKGANKPFMLKLKTSGTGSTSEDTCGSGPKSGIIFFVIDRHHILSFKICAYLFSNKIMIIYKQFTFDSAHFLPNVPDGHKCKGLHGHTYRLTVYAKGDIQKHAGWVVDFGDLKSAVKPVIETLDHAFLNNIAGLENPTAELVSVWLWDKIKPGLPSLTKIELKETPTSGVIYEGD